MNTSEMVALAERLTDARKAMLLALPADGSWGRVPNRAAALRAWSNVWPPIIDHKHCPEDASEWRLNDRGQTLRAALAQASSDGEDTK